LKATLWRTAHGATLLLSTKLLAMSKKSCLVCCGLKYALRHCGPVIGEWWPLATKMTPELLISCQIPGGFCQPQASLQNTAEHIAQNQCEQPHVQSANQWRCLPAGFE
jgi:hypothetical protein